MEIRDIDYHRMELNMTSNLRLRAAVLSMALFIAFLLVWQALTDKTRVQSSSTQLSPAQETALTDAGLSMEDVQYFAEKGLSSDQIQQIAGLGLTLEDIEASGGVEAFGFTSSSGGAEEAKSGFPGPMMVWGEAYEQITDPFYDKGPNDKGIGIQLKYSLYRVGAGFLLALIIAVPVGFLIGMSPLVNMALSPFIQILKPISPLAWLPVALFIIKDAEQASIFVIFVCSIWPMLINTAFGVAAVNKDYLNIARTLELTRLQTAFKVILPAAAPTIFTGMKISIGIAWLVIVAAEMVIGGIGVGYFVWNEWNGLNLASMIFAIFVIGLVGLVLDFMIGRLLILTDYKE